MSRPLFAAAALSLAFVAPACHPRPDPGESVSPDPSASAPSCPGAAGLDQLWTAERREASAESWAQLPGEWPAQLLETIDARLDERGPRWRADYDQACAAEQHQLMRCLDAQRWQLDAALTLATTDPSWAARIWPELDAALAGAAGCHAPVEGASLDEARGRWWALARLQRRYLDGENRAAALAAHLEREPDPEPGQVAEASAALDLSRQLDAALIASAAGSSSDADTAADQARDIAATLGPRAELMVASVEAELAAARGQTEASLAALDRAVAIAREQDDPWLLVDRLHALATRRLELARDPEGAVAPLTEAIAEATRFAGGDSPRAAAVQLTLAEALTKLGKIEAAHDLLTQARDSFVLHLGPDHPATLATVESIGRLFFVAGQPGDAQYAYLDLLDVYDQLYGPKHWRVARVKLALGDALMAMEQVEGAKRMYTEAITPIVKHFGPDHRDAIRTTIHLGLAELALGNLDEAETHCGRGINLAKALADDDPLADEAAACLDGLKLARKQAKRRKPR